MIKLGWPVLVPAFVAVAIVGTKLANFDIPEMLKINTALAGVGEKDAPKVEVPKSTDQTLSQEFGFTYLKNGKPVTLKTWEEVNPPSSAASQTDMKNEPQ